MKNRKDINTKNENENRWAFQREKIRPRSNLKKYFICLAILVPLFLIFLFAVLPAMEEQMTVGAQTAAGSDNIVPADSFNMFVVIYDQSQNPISLMLFRLDALKKHMVVMPVPLDLMSKDDGSGLTLSNELEQRGVHAVIASLESSTGIDIQYHSIINSGELSELVELFGGFTYYIPENLTCNTPESSQTITFGSGYNFIDGDKALSLLSVSGRYDIQAGLMKAFISQKINGYYLGNSGSIL